VQVRLPEGAKAFDKSDLSGELEGSDGYSQLVGKSLLDDPSSGDYQTAEQHGRYGVLILLVPAGKTGGKDVVKVRSTAARDGRMLTIDY
jgi:hypothetical protein